MKEFRMFGAEMPKSTRTKMNPAKTEFDSYKQFLKTILFSLY